MSTSGVLKKSVAAAALCVTLTTAGAAFPSAAMAAPAAASKTPAAARAAAPSVGLNLSLDLLGLYDRLEGAIKRAQNRDGFVKNLMETAFYANGQKYNVMVHNLSQPYNERFRGVKTYGSATYNGVVYGIWVFTDGKFTNKGDGGYINWAFKGWFARKGGDVNFTRSPNL